MQSNGKETAREAVATIAATIAPIENTTTQNVTLLEDTLSKKMENEEIMKIPSTSAAAAAAARTLPESISGRVSYSWHRVAGNKEKVGIDFFLRLFGERPELLVLFRFGGISLQDGKLPTPLKIHALTVMDTLGACVAGLTKLDEIMPKLRSLGQSHGVFGVQEAHYDVVFKHLMDAIAAELPDEFDGEMRDAWEMVYRFLTGVMKNPNDLYQVEPVEGWGLLNAITCTFITVYVPFRMAGFTARNRLLENIFNCLHTMATLVAVLDMFIHTMSSSRSSRSFPNQSKRSFLRRHVDRWIFPIKFRFNRFLRSLKMDRWAGWPRVNAMIILSFIIQNMEQFRHGGVYQPAGGAKAGVHWIFGFGFLGLAAGIRVLHCIQCAENNMMLRRQLHQDERLTLRVCKLIGVLTFVIHVAACLWCIIARIEMGPETIDPISSPFFPDHDLLLGGQGILNSYVHAVHWAWVNLAGIGGCDSTPVSTLECVATLLVHICGATLYAITTGNVVAILENMTEEQDQTGADLAELGGLMQACHVPRAEQERIFQGYMMHNLRGGKRNETRTVDCIDNGELPAAVDRLPGYIQVEVSSYIRAEAIKRRDAAFAHCSNEFLLSLVSALHQKTMLLTGDYFVQARDKIPQQVFLVEKGTLEVILNGKCTRTLERGDIIGKRWLLTLEKSSSTSDEFSRSLHPCIRAHSGCTLISGLADPEDVEHLRSRYKKDFLLLKADKERVYTMRAKLEKQRSETLIKSGIVMV